MNVLLLTMITSGENGDSEGDGCNRGLTGIDGDELGVKNGPDGDNIPLMYKMKKKDINKIDS